MHNSGHAVIFNQENFSGGLPVRTGTEEDVIALEDTFDKLNITTEVHDDFKVDDIKKAITEISTRDFTKERYLIVTILSHGHKDNLISARDGTYNLDDVIVSPICTNPTLKGKPKIFFIQACKGSQKMQPDGGENSDEVFLFYATTENYVSYRSAGGSIFIQNLCDVLEDYGKTLTFLEIVDLVCDKVEEESEAVNHYQEPSFEHDLTKDFHLYEETSTDEDDSSDEETDSDA